MLNFFREQLAIHRFKRSTLGQALRDHTQQYFYGETALSSFSEANKQKLIQDFMAKLAAIVSSPNEFLALREAIAEYTILFAQLQVLCLTEAEKADACPAALQQRTRFYRLGLSESRALRRPCAGEI